MALWVNLRPTAPESPLAKSVAFPVPPPPPRDPDPNPPPTKFLAVVNPLAAIKSSAIMEPPVRPTFTPRVDMKLSIFWLTLRKAMAHRNQTNRFPEAFLPSAGTEPLARQVMGTDTARTAVVSRK